MGASRTLPVCHSNKENFKVVLVRPEGVNGVQLVKMAKFPLENLLVTDEMKKPIVTHLYFP
jgi:hypothetical protein